MEMVRDTTYTDSVI